MRRRYVLLVLLGLLNFACFAQEFKWAKKTSVPASFKRKLLTSKTDAVYEYGSKAFTPFIENQGPFDNDTIGSFLKKYGKDGNLLVDKRWKTTFYITEIRENRAGELYFSGFFYNTINVDGEVLTSKGLVDAVVGKMDAQGNIRWAHSFGGSHNDNAMGLYLDDETNELYITGSAGDTVFCGGRVFPGHERSYYIAQFTSDGQVSSLKLFDHLTDYPEATGYNWGFGIERDRNGNLYLLHGKEGRSWASSDSAVAMEGRYISKFSPDGDPLWSSFVINFGCYYGMGCHSLKVNDDGDAYVLKWCGGKYGGNGYMVRFDSHTGEQKWEYNNGNCYYRGMSNALGNGMILLGNEGGVPYGPASSYGYDIIKKYSTDNAVLWEKRIDDVQMLGIAQDDNGDIYISGSILKDTVVIGSDTIFNNQGYTYGSFLLKLSDPDAPLFNEQLPVPMNAFTLFPNPGSRLFAIRSGIEITDAKLHIYSLTGKEVRTIQLGSSLTEFDLGDLSSGVYIYKVEDRGGNVLFINRLTLVRE